MQQISQMGTIIHEDMYTVYIMLHAQVHAYNGIEVLIYIDNN